VPETRDDPPDFVFRFRIPRRRGEEAGSDLDEFYRTQLLGLAKMVQFYFRGEHVDVDSFAFRNAPEKVIALLGEAGRAKAAEPDTAPRLRPAPVPESADL
jgi:hypothetical protein